VIQSLSSLQATDVAAELRPPPHRRGTCHLGWERGREACSAREAAGEDAPTSINSGRGDGSGRRSRRREAPLPRKTRAEHHLDDDLPSNMEPGRTEDGCRQRVKQQLQRKEAVSSSTAPPRHRGRLGAKQPHTHHTTLVAPSLPQPAERAREERWRHTR
jgi:hypothetical protein